MTFRSALAALTAALALSACESRVRPIDELGGAVTACATCHGDPARVAADPLLRAAPPRSPSGEGVGAHLAHLAGGTFRAPLPCAECHYVPTLNAHADGSADVPMPGLAAADGASPSWSAASATCSGVYCHGATLGGGPAETPAWSSTADLTCSSCHGLPPPAPHPAGTSCGGCHAGYTASAVNAETHLNGVVNASGGHPDGYAAPAEHGGDVNAGGLDSCQACHGAALDGGSSGVSCNACHGGTAWQTSCTFCHGDVASGRASPPLDTQGLALRTNVSVGAHAAHVGATRAAPLACTECHPSRAGSNVLADGAHVDGDGIAEVAFGTRAGASADYTRASDTSATCSSVYCHGTANTIEWTSTAALGCGACHGAPPSGDHPPSTSCGDCHEGYGPASVNPVTHVDGTVQSSSGHSAGYASPTVHGREVNRVGLASCKSCHGTGLASCNACHGSTAWQTSCTFCHGDAASGRASPPLDTQGLALRANVSVGAHAAHVATTMTAPLACTECHPDRAGSNVTTDGAHVDGDGIAEVELGARAGASAAYSRTSGTSATCSSTYCHGTANTVEWTSTTALDCTSCHGSPPAAPHTASTSCDGCHAGYTRTSVNPATHVNGVPDATTPHVDGFGAPAVHGYEASRTGLAACQDCHGTSLTSCNACHGGSTAWQTSCTFCHGDTGSGRQSPPVDTQGRSLRTNVSVGAHAAHVATTMTAPLACTECHPDRAGSNVTTDGAHVDGDGIAEVELGARAGASAAYSRTSGTSATCSSTYCHGTANTVEWTSTTALDCTSCHGSPPPAPHTTGTSCGGCHTGYTRTSVNPATHVNGVPDATTPHPGGFGAPNVHGYEVNRTGLAACQACHGTSLTSCNACHGGSTAWQTSCTFCHGDTGSGRQSPPVDTQGRSLTTNVSVGVHASHVATTWATPLACTECHPDRAGSNVTTDGAHVDGDGIAEVELGTLARTGGAEATYARASATSATCASTYCHGRFYGGANTGLGATVNWTSTTQVTCTSCHGIGPSTGQHSRHATKAGCYICHNTVVDAARAIVNPALHVNGTDDVSFGGIYSTRPVTGTWYASSRGCDVSCHPGLEAW
jgi:predicted CxxxxCH...CXXCH cytochrome family protein